MSGDSNGTSVYRGYLFTLGVFLLLIVPRVVTLGFFADGMIYAAIARNMAEGLGSFWAPHYTSLFGEIFYEHPPLSFWLHSFLYRIFGDLPLLDGLYGMLLGAGVLYLTAAIYRKFSPAKESWSPMLFLLLMPMFTWAFGNNILENLMTFMAVLAVYVQCYKPKGRIKSLAVYFFSGAILALGVLAKSPAVLFPLAFPFFHWLILREGSFADVIFHTAAISAGFLTAVAVILFPAGGEVFLKQYIDGQLLKSIAGQRGHDNRWILTIQSVLEPGTAAAIAGVIWFFFRKKVTPRFTREALLFLVIGACAILPLFLIPKQRTYYLLPGLPFLAIALASFFEPVMNELGLWYQSRIEAPLRRRQAWLPRAPLALFLGSCALVGALLWGAPGRMPEFFHDLYPLDKKVSEPIPKNSPLLFCHPKLNPDYSLISHVERYLNLDPVRSTSMNHPLPQITQEAQKKYWILRDKDKNCTLPSNCAVISLGPTKRYDILSCRIDHDKK